MPPLGPSMVPNTCSISVTYLAAVVSSGELWGWVLRRYWWVAVTSSRRASRALRVSMLSGIEDWLLDFGTLDSRHGSIIKVDKLSTVFMPNRDIVIFISVDNGPVSQGLKRGSTQDTIYMISRKKMHFTFNGYLLWCWLIQKWYVIICSWLCK